MQQKPGFWQRLYDQLASIKLTVIMLLLIAASALVGTLIPQGLSQEELLAQYGPRLANWIDLLLLDDLYHAPWFSLMLMILCVNLIVCTLRRLPKTLKLLRYHEQSVEPQKLTKFSYHHKLESKLEWSNFIKRIEAVVGQEFAPVKQLEAGSNYAAIAEKGRWSRLVVYLIHLSVLVIFLGALMGSLFGFKGFMNISEGSSAADVMPLRGHRGAVLPFQIRCDHFDVSFYDTGAPKEYRSDLTILENGREMLKGSILVNDPLSYKGVTIYQASYGTTLKSAVVEFIERDSGKAAQLTLPFMEKVPLSGTPYEVQAVQYQENLRNVGPALGVVLLKDGQEVAGSWILTNVPNFHGNRIQNYQVKVLSAEPSHYTGLQVKSDPGVWFVYVGFVLLVVSTGITFYSSHRKVWVWAADHNPNKVLHLAAKTNKNSLAFEREFNQLLEHLQHDLKGEKRK